MNRRDNDLALRRLNVFLQSRRTLGASHTLLVKALVLLHRLVVQILAVYHEEDLINEVNLRRQLCRLKARERLARTSCVPDVAPALRLAPELGLVRAPYLPEQSLGGGDLIGAHDQERIALV